MEFVEVEGVIIAETAQAILLDLDNDPFSYSRPQSYWLPRGYIEVEILKPGGRPTAKVTVPEWLAVEKGLA